MVVLAVACSHRVPTGLGIQRADEIAAGLPKQAWQRISAGAGAKGFRYYDWAFITRLTQLNIKKLVANNTK